MTVGTLSPFQILASGTEAERIGVAHWIAQNFATELAGASGPKLYLAICRIVRDLGGHVEELNRIVMPLVTDQDKLQDDLAEQLKCRIHRAVYRQQAPV